jgi:hypothetical protein
VASQWHFLESGKVFGPLTTSQFREYAREGRIGPGTRVRKGRDGHWVAARQVKGLFNRPARATVPVAAPWMPPDQRQPLAGRQASRARDRSARVTQDEQRQPPGGSQQLFPILVTGGIAGALALMLVLGLVFLTVRTDVSSPPHHIQSNPDSNGVAVARPPGNEGGLAAQVRKANEEQQRQEQEHRMEEARERVEREARERQARAEEQQRVEALRVEKERSLSLRRQDIQSRLALLRNQQQATERIIRELEQQVASWKARFADAAAGNTTSLVYGNAMSATGSLHVEMERLRQINEAIQQLEWQLASLGM